MPSCGSTDCVKLEMVIEAGEECHENHHHTPVHEWMWLTGPAIDHCLMPQVVFVCSVCEPDCKPVVDAGFEDTMQKKRYNAAIMSNSDM